MGAPGCPTPKKRGYDTAAQADRVMWAMLRRPGTKKRDWQKLNVYRCQCGKYHVGHSGRRIY
jgi:hypothetical protein